MPDNEPLKIGITCYPSVGGSGILATALGEDLARRGHAVHFISYERPFRLPEGLPNLHFHPVQINDYNLFKYPDYTLPLSVKMAEVTRDHALDILHVHYAVPHATAAILARDMLPPSQKPRIVTTLHGTDTTLLGRDPAYAPAIRHSLDHSDAVTCVSHWLERETRRVLGVTRPIDVVHNFFTPKPARRSRDDVRRELGLLPHQHLLIHISNLRPIKRIDLLLQAASLIRPQASFKLLILAGDDFSPFLPDAKRLGLEDRLIVREREPNIEDYLQAADLGLFTSESESFCLSILEAMCFAVPSVAFRVGGIPEFATPDAALLLPFGDPAALARAAESLLADPARRTTMGQAAKQTALKDFSAAIVPKYLNIYRRVCGKKG